MAFQESKVGTGTTSVVITMTTAVAVGDLIVLAYCSNTATTSGGTCTDSLGNVYSVVGAKKAITGGFGIWGSWSAPVTVAGTPTVTIGGISGGSSSSAICQSFVGAGTRDAVSAVATGTTSPFTAGSVTTTNANDVLVGLFVWATSSSGTATGTGSWAQATTTAVGGSCKVGLENQTVAATGAYTATATLTVVGQWEAYTAGFKVGGGAAGVTIQKPAQGRMSARRRRASIW